MSYPPQGLDKSDVLANQTSIIGTVDDKIEAHLHNDQQVAPWGSSPITLTSGAGAYTWGDYSDDFIAAAALSNLFDIHWVILSGASANADYEIEIVYGASDTLACRVAFSRSNAFTASIALPLLTHQIPAGSRIRARMRDSVGSATVQAKVLYHEYE